MTENKCLVDQVIYFILSSDVSWSHIYKMESADDAAQSSIQEQVAQRGCEASGCGDAQNPTGHSAGQPARAAPAEAGDLDLKSHFQLCNSLQFKLTCSLFTKE